LKTLIHLSIHYSSSNLHYSIIVIIIIIIIIIIPLSFWVISRKSSILWNLSFFRLFSYSSSSSSSHLFIISRPPNHRSFSLSLSLSFSLSLSLSFSLALSLFLSFSLSLFLSFSLSSVESAPSPRVALRFDRLHFFSLSIFIIITIQSLSDVHRAGGRRTTSWAPTEEEAPVMLLLLLLFRGSECVVSMFSLFLSLSLSLFLSLQQPIINSVPRHQTYIDLRHNLSLFLSLGIKWREVSYSVLRHHRYSLSLFLSKTQHTFSRPSLSLLFCFFFFLSTTILPWALHSFSLPLSLSLFLSLFCLESENEVSRNFTDRRSKNERGTQRRDGEQRAAAGSLGLRGGRATLQRWRRIQRFFAIRWTLFENERGGTRVIRYTS